MRPGCTGLIAGQPRSSTLADLFISYAREDEDRIRVLVAALEGRGWTVFWDRRIPAGASWHTQIAAALRDARCVLVAWSRHSISSRWVFEEAEDAQARGVLIPILLDRVAPPIGFRSIQAADFTRMGSNELEQLFRDIEAALRSSVQGPAITIPIDASTQTDARFPSNGRGVLRRLTAAGIVVALVGLGAAGWYLAVKRGEPAETEHAQKENTASLGPGVTPHASPGSAATPKGGGGEALPRPGKDDSGLAVRLDQTRIAFISSREGEPAMYVMNVDGSAQRRLSPPGGADIALAWSPDGLRIAFISYRGGKSALHVMRSNGAQAIKLSEARAHVRPTWSPDGNKIAFTSDHEGSADIYVIAELNEHTMRRLTSEPSNESDPSWSPDGAHIAFTSDRDGTHEIYVMNASGSQQRRLTTPPTEASELAWSPDGKRIAYVTRSGLSVINTDGSGARGLVTYLRAMSPSWSPDSREIAFQGMEKSDFDIYVVNSDGSNVRNLTRNAAADYRPSWSPVLRTTPRDFILR